MSANDTYSLEDRDEIMVVDAGFALSIPEPGAHYTLMIVSENGRRLLLNASTRSITDAARRMQVIRHDGEISLADWTDVTDLFRGIVLDKKSALTVPHRDQSARRFRPVHPYAEPLSLLLEGDVLRIVQIRSPVPSAEPVWLVLVFLSEGIILQHLIPLESSDAAMELVTNMAQAGGFVTDDFFDATSTMGSVRIDLSTEVPIDMNGNPRFDS